MPDYEYRSAIGQDSHRFMSQGEWAQCPDRCLILAGIPFAGVRPLHGNSDADVILHALTNAISGLTGVNILGAVSDRLCLEKGITDSVAYLSEALATLEKWQLRSISISIEGKRPKMAPAILDMKQKLAELTGIQASDVGLTATSGEDLTAFGQGEGLQAFCMVTARRVAQD